MLISTRFRHNIGVNIGVCLCFIYYVTLTSAEWNSKDYQKREHSLVKPYQGTGITIPYWDFLGHTIVTANYVRLTADVQSRQGAVWNSVPVKSVNWELQVQFKVSGKGKDLFGDGLAIWYTKERMESGPVFGSKNFFQGLAVILDTYSNHNGPHNHQHPYISAMVSNGTLHYDHDKDGTHTELSGCEAKFRNFDYDTHISIRYEGNKLTVMTDMENKAEWKECFTIEGIILPVGYYIGLSAATGELSDNHDIISIRFYQLDTIEDDKLLLERTNILPSAEKFESPRERSEDTPKSSWGGVKTFLLMMFCAVVIMVIVVLGIMYYQKQQERSRKRFY